MLVVQQRSVQLCSYDLVSYLSLFYSFIMHFLEMFQILAVFCTYVHHHQAFNISNRNCTYFLYKADSGQNLSLLNPGHFVVKTHESNGQILNSVIFMLRLFLEML